jgi:hypothetical protein
MADLSPSARAVKDHFLANVPIGLEQGLAAALRAAVKQTQFRQYRNCFICDAAELLALAAELDNNSTH